MNAIAIGVEFWMITELIILCGPDEFYVFFKPHLNYFVNFMMAFNLVVFIKLLKVSNMFLWSWKILRFGENRRINKINKRPRIKKRQKFLPAGFSYKLVFKPSKSLETKFKIKWIFKKIPEFSDNAVLKTPII